MNEQKEINKEKFRKLFKWIKDTKELIDNDMVDQDLSNKVIEHHIALINNLEDKVDFLIEMKYVEFSKNMVFFADKMIKEEDIIPSLKYMMQKSDHSNKFLKYIIPRFLNLDNDIRKDLYEQNFTMRATGDVLLICQVRSKFWPNDIFHNIPTLIRFHNRENMLNDVMVDVDKDIANLIKDNKKLHQFKTGKVLFGNIKEVTGNWSTWNMSEHQELIDLFTNKFFYRNEFKANQFLDEVDKGMIPYDLIYKGNQVIKMIIRNTLHSISANLNSFKTTKEIHNSNEPHLKLLERIGKYNLYFLDKEKLVTSFELHIEKTGFKKYNPETYKEYLDTVLCLTNLNKEEQKIEKKQKL